MKVLKIIKNEDSEIKTEAILEDTFVIYIVLKNGEEYRISDNLTELRIQNTTAPINIRIASRSGIGIRELKS